MKKKAFLKKTLSSVLSTFTIAALSAAAAAAPAHADQVILSFKGDVNLDGVIDNNDFNIIARYILGANNIPQKAFANADMNNDNTIDSLDLIKLRNCITGLEKSEPILGEGSSPSAPKVTTVTVPATTTTKKPATTTTTTTTTTSSTTAATTTTYSYEFITPPLEDMFGSLPSQGHTEMAVFYVDFPDCQYAYAPTAERIQEIMFGPEDTANPCYPNESVRAYYLRASKGVFDLNGSVYRYTAKYPKAYYEEEGFKTLITDEVLSNFDNILDYNNYDANADGIIDAVLISVPTSAGSENWWPTASTYGGSGDTTFDGLRVGHVIIGNSEIESYYGFKNFTSSYTHETAHCMGLPDYYIPDDEYIEGLHGSAGFELMDEVYSDLSAVSKLMLGWYRDDQIKIYSGKGSEKYILHNAQTDEGNCLIIPCGELDENYRSEFIILEYSTLDGNNSAIPREYAGLPQGCGIRAYHVDAEVDPDDYWRKFKYQNSNNAYLSPEEQKRRFVRVVNDFSMDNLMKEQDVFSSGIDGFRFYDENGNESIDPGVFVLVNEESDGGYNIVIRKKG